MTQINSHEFLSFVKRTIGGDKLTHDKANHMGIKEDKFDDADANDNNFLEIDEILDNKDLYEQFAVLFDEEKEKESAEVDKKKAEEEQSKVGSKGGSTAA